MRDMGLAEFANEVKERRGRLSQADLAVLSGVSKRLIERLEALKGDAPFTERNQAIDLASALGWDINDALDLLGYSPLSDREREYLEGDAVREKFDRLWPRLTPEQRHGLVNMVASMVIKRAPQTPPPGGHRETRVTPGSGKIPKHPGQRDNGESSSS